jgi:CNT family concentrative nucleoside transporter
MKKVLFVFLTFIVCLDSFGQSLEQEWVFSAVENDSGEVLFPVNPKSDLLILKDGFFQYTLQAKNNLKASGSYIFQNKLLVLFYNKPNDTIRKYRISKITDSTLVLSENNVQYFFSNKVEEIHPAVKEDTKHAILASKGFTLKSLWRGILGMFSLLVIAFLCSSNRRAIPWNTVGIGLMFQLIIAIGVLKIEFIRSIFEFIGKLFVKILDFTQAGSKFLFEGLVVDLDTFGFIFAFQVLPTIIFFSALTSVLFYLGLIQKAVRLMGLLLSKVLGISGAESLSVAGNIFLGQTEAPLLIKAYLEKMNKSEMLLVMIGGMATLAGAVLAAYIGFLGGDDPIMRLIYAKHLLAASAMAAPGAIVVSKILYPQTEPINTYVEVAQDKIGSNILDALSKGTTQGLKLAVNVGAMLLVFVAFIAMLNGILGKAGELSTLNEWIAANSSYSRLSLEAILGTVFAPLMWIIGVAREDMMMMGQLLGIKIAASEFVGYIQLAALKDGTNIAHLKYEKSVIMATYMLCGFANFASIGIQIGGIGSLAPGQRKVLSKLGMKALLGGTIASLMSATMAGMILG